MKKFMIYIDDERKSPSSEFYGGNYEVASCRTYQGAINVLTELDGTEFGIDLDHDLGEEKTGYDICEYMLEYDIWPEVIYLHSQNSVGRANMKQLLTHYGYNVKEY